MGMRIRQPALVLASLGGSETAACHVGGKEVVMDEDLRDESYKGHEITSRPVSVDLPGSETSWHTRMDIISPDRGSR